MRLKKEKGIIVAFDMEDTEFALELARDLRGARGNFVIKVGRPLEMRAGIGILAQIKDASGLPIIYDGKIADIPCLLYTSPSPRDISGYRMPSSA